MREPLRGMRAHATGCMRERIAMSRRCRTGISVRGPDKKIVTARLCCRRKRGLERIEGKGGTTLNFATAGASNAQDVPVQDET